MRSRSRPPWILILGGTVAVVIVLGAVWAVAPADARGLLMLAGGALTVAVYPSTPSSGVATGVHDPVDARRLVI